jgi:hypothetical protein
MKIKLVLAGLLLMTGMAFGQSQFAGGGGGLKASGNITPGDCAEWVNATTLEDSGSACGSSTAVTNQVEGQLPTSLGSATSLAASTPYVALVSAYCGSTTSCNPGGGITDEAHAIRAIVTAYNCLAANNASCNIIDDMTGVGYFSEEPLPNSFSGRLTFETNGIAHEIYLDGMSTLTLPGATQMFGMGTTGTDQIGENTTIAMCNPLTDNCPNGGFLIQNSSATTLGLSASGSVTTVTFTASVNFTTTSTALNQLTAGRKLCIAGATGTIWNGCFVIASVTGSSGCSHSSYSIPTLRPRPELARHLADRQWPISIPMRLPLGMAGVEVYTEPGSGTLLSTAT